MSEQIQDLTQQIQQQAVDSAKDFYGDALGQVKGQLEDSREQLENLLGQLPEGQEATNEIQELVDSYDSILGALDETAETQGVEDVVNGAVEQAQDTAEETTEQAQDTAEEATEQAEGVVGAGDRAGRGSGRRGPGDRGERGRGGPRRRRRGCRVGRKPGPGQPATQRGHKRVWTGRAAGRGRVGDIIETTLDEAGELLSEDITGKITDLPKPKATRSRAGRRGTTRSAQVRTNPVASSNLTLGEDGNLLDLDPGQVLRKLRSRTQRKEESEEESESPTPPRPQSRRPKSWAWTSPGWKARGPTTASPSRT